MSTPANYDHLVPLVPTPDAQFDAFWASLLESNPDLSTPGKLEMPVEGFRAMLKLAFLAGKVATAEQLISE